MNILLVTDAYPPEIRSSSHLMLELAQELVTRGHKVTVLTSWPQYNLSSPQAAAGIGVKAVEDGVTVIRVKTLPHHKVNFVVRGIAQLMMPRQFLRALRRHGGRDYQAVIVYSPPLPLAGVGSALRRKGAFFALNIQDVFPQNAIDLGVLRNPMLIAMFRAMERAAYRNADRILVHSESNLEFLKRENPRVASKIAVLHNWVDGKSYQLPASRRFREKYGLQDKFIIGFAGVMGPSQQLDLIVEAAAKLGELKDLAFLFVGDGGESENLKALARQYETTNVHFQPFIPREEYPELLKNFDVGLVCLSPKNHTPVVPGKLLTYMAASLPVLAVLNRESDGNVIVRAADCGLAVPSDDKEAIAEAIRTMYESRSRLGAWGAQGQAYVDKNFEKAAVISELEKYLA
ncbi:MAG: glycosyltransferase family 4 protein [Rhodospirillaceae bacterium]|nr:glycosyltransferase family 4 protein [Rhodospirillaceae bacterium]MBT3926437.1 glycosyltransferase family 4 protein [Rhodospirillaceae bacterium]